MKIFALALILFVAAAVPESLAVSSVSLEAKLTSRGRVLTLSLLPAETAQGCEYSVYAGRRAAVDSADKLVASAAGGASLTAIRGGALRALRRSGGAVRRRVFFVAYLACGDDTAVSNTASISLRTKPGRGVRSVDAWLEYLKTRIVAGSLAIEEAFPALSFEKPVDIQSAGDTRLFVVEQGGAIQLFTNASSTTTKSGFLNIASKVKSDGAEQGLLGMAFHPNFSSNGLFFVNYTRKDDGATVVERYLANPASGLQADPATAFEIITIDQPFANHNGGQLAFGPDGYLYIGLGDGGSGGDPQGNGQNKKALLGKMLRIDVDTAAQGKSYSIPSTNPYAGNQQGFREEIFALGLRNPWRFAFDMTTKLLWAADVGQNAIEEVDIIEKGKNYGWNTTEGSSCYSPSSGCDKSGLTMPVAEYTHAVGQSITGGYVYRGSQIPALRGRYIYADFVSGRVWSLNYANSKAEVTQLFDTDLNISTFGQDKDKELYFASYSEGKIYKLTAQ